MRIEPFRMERMQSTYENYVDYNLSESGVQPMRASDLLQHAGGADPFLALELGYNQSNGTEELRDRVAAFYPDASRDNVLLSNGGSEANFTALWSLLERGDRVAFMLPNYLQTWGLSRAFASAADVFRLVPQGDGVSMRWALDVDSLRKAVTRKTRVILVTNPNNPTGGILNESEMDEVVRAARRSGATIVADEIYRGAEVSGTTTPTFWGRHDRVVITSGLSKAFGLPGLRVGWIVGPAPLIKRMWSHRDYTTIAPGTLSDYLARAALEPARRQAIFTRTRFIIRANLPVLEAWMRRHPAVFTYVPPLAGAILFARYALPLGSVTLADKLRVEKSVLIVPGDHLGAPRHIRIGFGSEAGYLQRGLARIDETIAAVQQERAVRGKPSARRPAPSASS